MTAPTGYVIHGIDKNGGISVWWNGNSWNASKGSAKVYPDEQSAADVSKSIDFAFHITILPIQGN